MQTRNEENFYPRPPRGGRPGRFSRPVLKNIFLSTSPAWGTTHRASGGRHGDRISIHVPRVGDDASSVTASILCKYDFYPRPPRGGRRPPAGFARPALLYFYPRPPRGGRRTERVEEGTATEFLSTSPAWGTTSLSQTPLPLSAISIHVPRVGDDTAAALFTLTFLNFYPRPPRGGRLYIADNADPALAKFLSTSPAWGTTSACKSCLSWPETFLSTSPAWGTTHDCWCKWLNEETFLSTSPAWGTTNTGGEAKHTLTFLSTSPAWGTTRNILLSSRRTGNFYPRPPRGGRRGRARAVQLPAGISIHVPRVGDDMAESPVSVSENQFLSTSPAWGTTQTPYLGSTKRLISIHVPRVGDDAQGTGDPTARKAISIHVPRVGDDRPRGQSDSSGFHFYPRPPRGGRRGSA